MTTRVFDCNRAAPGLRPLTNRPGGGPIHTPGFKLAVLTTVLVVPLAGAAEPPEGWAVAALTGGTILILARLVGQRAHWGWLTLLCAGVAVVTPRGQVAVLGPALFVATGLCLVLWLAGRRPDQPGKTRARPVSPEREAQLAMGMSGERHVGQVMARELPQEFVLINGLKLPRGAGDIDHLVVGPSGVFVLETKTMAGRVVCDPDGTWRRTKVGRAGTPYAAYIGDPAAQVQRNILAVRDCLRAEVPALFRRPSLWIEGLVVFAHPRTDLEADNSRVPAVRLDQAAPRIFLHEPQRPLEPHEVDRVVEALLVEGRERPRLAVQQAQSAQAVVEVALVLPVVLALLFGTLAISRVVQAQTAVVAVAHEAARAAALGSGPDDAVNRMRQRVDVVAPGLGLDPRALVLDWDVSGFGNKRGQVVAAVRYRVELGDLPVVGWVPVPIVRAEHVEWVDPFRSGVARVEDPTR